MFALNVIKVISRKLANLVLNIVQVDLKKNISITRRYQSRPNLPVSLRAGELKEQDIGKINDIFVKPT